MGFSIPVNGVQHTDQSVIPPNISVIPFVEGDTCDNNEENSVIPPNISVIPFVEGDTCDNNQENSVIPPNISVIPFVEGDTCDNNQENSVIPPNISVIPPNISDIPSNISVIPAVEGDTCDYSDNNKENSVIPPNISVILSLLMLIGSMSPWVLPDPVPETGTDCPFTLHRTLSPLLMSQYLKYTCTDRQASYLYKVGLEYETVKPRRNFNLYTLMRAILLQISRWSGMHMRKTGYGLE